MILVTIGLTGCFETCARYMMGVESLAVTRVAEDGAQLHEVVIAVKKMSLGIWEDLRSCLRTKCAK
jgi:hypothetical protein